MTEPSILSREQRIDLAATALKEGRIAQGFWRQEDDGREIVCALAAFGPDINGSGDCPADLMPPWLAADQRLVPRHHAHQSRQPRALFRKAGRMTPDLEATQRAALARATPLPWYTLDPPWLPGGAETSILAENPDADAALIVAAVNALPTLLDTLAALRAQVEGLRRNADAWVRWYKLADVEDDCEGQNHE